MDPYNQPGPSESGSSFALVNVVFVILGVVALYYLYRFLYPHNSNTDMVTVISGQQSASTPVSITKPPTPFEGGEYSVNTWVYVSSFNKNRNMRKHVLELKGEYFSTLLIALGAFKNTLTVRTHSEDFVSGFQSGNGSGSGSTTGSRTTTAPPNTQSAGSLAVAKVNDLFKPMAMDDALLPPPICDLPEIDLQRWTMITVVLSGRTIDVYMDGKLSRSCTSSSYYKVDPTGVTLSINDRGGFDGYMGLTSLTTHSMNPDEIYRAYLSGPSGSSLDVLSWVSSIFKGAKTS